MSVGNLVSWCSVRPRGGTVAAAGRGQSKGAGRAAATSPRTSSAPLTREERRRAPAYGREGEERRCAWVGGRREGERGATARGDWRGERRAAAGGRGSAAHMSRRVGGRGAAACAAPVERAANRRVEEEQRFTGLCALVTPPTACCRSILPR
uniref:Uncharacterized protein n=1 Tax=Oryza sativa subsp. japonica TaxID=39947 RepID=Q6ZHN9_ORYSJ|nr:hypothetical protein [Oryza sativa Japonica Group]